MMNDSSDMDTIRGPYFAGVLYDPQIKKFEIFSTNSISRYLDDANNYISTMVKDENGYLCGPDFKVVYFEKVSEDVSAMANQRREEIKSLDQEQLIALIKTQSPGFTI